MSRPDSLTTEELRAVVRAVAERQSMADLWGWSLDECAALASGRDKLFERLAHRQAHARSGTAPDPARTR